MKYVFVLLFLVHFEAYCQVTITGQVVDIKNNPVGSATIDLAGKNTTTTTDDLGLFSMKLSSEIKKGDIIILRISKVGFRTSTKQIAASPLSISVRLIKSKVFNTSLIASNTEQTGKSQVNTPIQPPINVTSYDQSGGITAGVVNIGSAPRTLDEKNKNLLLSNLPNKEEKIDITSVLGDAESFQYAQDIKNFLTLNEYKNIDGVNQSVFTQPVIGQFFYRDSTSVKILIGSKK